MYLILFRSRLTSEAGPDYQDAATEMLAYAKQHPGYVDFRQYTADDGERLTVVRWKDAETLQSWREDPRHVAAKKRGRELWYETYDIDIAELKESKHFDR